METTKLTNEEIIKKIQESHLDEDHKERLITLVPQMEEEDQERLFSLIEESFDVKAKEDAAQKGYQEELAKLNTEFEGKIKDLEKEMTHYAQGEFQKVEKQESEEAVSEIESEIENL